LERDKKMRMNPHRVIPVVVVVTVLLAMAAIAGGSVQAQGTSGTPSPVAGIDTAHPAHIHDGTCATLGSVKWPLNDVSAAGLMTGTPAAGTPVATPSISVGASPTAGLGPVVAGSTTIVEVALADLQKAPFAVNVHESMDNIANYIACGDITGEFTDGSLTISLNELNSSGFSGTATLNDNGDGTTTVTIQLMQAMN
jgi:hypothetical protein